MADKKIQPTNPTVTTSKVKDVKDAEDEKASARKTAASHRRKSGRKTNSAGHYI